MNNLGRAACYIAEWTPTIAFAVLALEYDSEFCVIMAIVTAMFCECRPRNGGG